MYKLSILCLFVLFYQTTANIDATNFGIPEDTHQTGFGGAIPLSSGLADEGEAQLQLVDVSPADESQQNVNHVKEMFSNAFNSIRSQREKAKEQQGEDAQQPTAV